MLLSLINSVWRYPNWYIGTTVNVITRNTKQRVQDMRRKGREKILRDV